MVSPSTTCVRRLGDFRKAYVDSLSRQLEDVEAAVQAMKTSPADAAGAREAFRLLQGVVGTAGPMGFGGVCRAAASLRSIVRDCLEAEPRDVSVLHRQAEAGLEDIRRQTRFLSPKPAAEVEARPGPALLLVGGDDTLAASLAHYGYEVRRAAGVKEAREQVLAARPAAVLAEAAGEDPAPLLEELRRAGPMGAPVFLLTRRDDLASRIEAVRAGVDGVFARPGEIGALVDRLNRTTEAAPKEPYRVLLVDDDPVAGGANAAALRAAGMRVRTVTDPLSVMAPLRETTPDVILLDMDMGTCTGEELAAVIRQHDEFVGVPIVFLSSESETARQLAARSVGADDFLVKPVPAERLAAEVTLRAERARTLRAHMLRDGQTGTLNHAAFMMQLRLEVERAKRAGRRLSLARVDVDRFHALNERQGHAEGDRVLRDLARLLQKRLRSTDVVARSGGDRFMVLLGDVDGQTAGAVLERIRASFAELRPGVTVRIGVASFPSQPDAELLVEAADKALARAAREGGNRVERAPE